jgi:hypothetical protein
MDRDERVDAWCDDIVEQVSVNGHLDHHGIRGQQVFRCPGIELDVGNGLRAKNDLLLGIDPHGDEISLVDVEADETGWRAHMILL